jgi:uncharacterized protein YcbK (DUF882 family)
MAKYFTPKELYHSDTAVAKGIDNTPPPPIAAKLATLANRLLDPARELWGAPITVNSGYRCPVLNKAVGGVATSQHTKGEAADITTGTVSGNKLLFGKIVAAMNRGEIEFDQLIDEKNYSWLHLSYNGSGNRRQILHLK